MMFLFLQLVFWLLIAGILGFAAGWFLQARRLGAKLTEQRERYRQHVQRLELGLADAGSEEEGPYAKERREPVDVSENSGSFLSGMDGAGAPTENTTKPEPSSKAESTGLKTGQTVTLSPLQTATLAGAPESKDSPQVKEQQSEPAVASALVDEPNAALVSAPAEWESRLRGCEHEISSLRSRLAILEGAEPSEIKSLDTSITADIASAPVADNAIQPYGLKEPDGAIDDLKRIWGVGPKLEKMLHGMGIYHFRQIAGFSPEDVESVSERLDQFSDRVKRDDWISQAKKLMAETK